MADETSHPFEQLDFIYTPSTDVEADARYFTDVLGGTLVFAVEGMGARVAAVELAAGAPLLLLADHVEGERPILVYRVDDLSAALEELESRGWSPEETFEIPHGPICSFRTPGGHRVALYQLTRPEAASHFDGRRDFLASPAIANRPHRSVGTGRRRDDHLRGTVREGGEPSVSPSGLPS